ncbi:hypothetical protein Pmani_035146 [Petrolisthes manimaculis]|uniref:Uncharacterized protein n=1 Tax=Petrolisthes manimaculis TaxID=1843537 RepID=A0AAE1TNZ1_9EUCA|nr:hypothetical protein Pmani_035146 [Petrolisthes manimaculis]
MATNPNGNLRITNNNNNGGGGASGGGGVKVDPRDPQVRKLVYNMYRGMLDQKHQKANVILDSTPQQHITKDEGVGSRVQSMM